MTDEAEMAGVSYKIICGPWLVRLVDVTFSVLTLWQNVLATVMSSDPGRVFTGFKKKKKKKELATV